MDTTKFKKFTKYDHFKAFAACDDRLKIRVTVISNEFTHNKFINKLMLL
jgi:hypothetical protein